jgi:NodT family efflux transporter outer membrane factor (OMF) lipoprotein
MIPVACIVPINQCSGRQIPMERQPSLAWIRRISGAEAVASPKRKRPTSLLICILLIAGFSGCHCVPGGRCKDWLHNGFKLGPNYSRPPAPVACQWIDYADPRVTTQEQQLCEWWTVFNDPTLNSLVQTAYQQNLTLRVAGARILAARAQLGVATGNLLPQSQSAFADYSRIKVSENTALPVSAFWFSNWDAGLSASWELDFWGRYRRAIESADAQLDASIENYDDVLVVLLSDVAANYVQYRTFEQRLVYARANVEIQSKSVQLATDKFEGGATTERDVHQARQVLEQTEALIPSLEIGKRQSANAICVLLGMPPADLEAFLGAGSGVPVASPDVVVGVPADLVRRRPDVRRAERLVAAQSALIGVSVSDLYPHISLLGTIGVQSEEFGDLFKTPGSMIGAIGPGVRWDILNYGRLVNNVRVQDARFQELAYAYQNKVLEAGREVEDAMVVFLRSQEQAEHLGGSVDAAERTVEITKEQYSQGEVDFTPVFLFESILTTQQDQLAVAQGDIALGLIGVYRSIGGGWQMRLQRYPGPPGLMALPAPEEVPAPDEADDAVDFQTFESESVSAQSVDPRLNLPPAVLPVGLAPVPLPDATESATS